MNAYDAAYLRGAADIARLPGPVLPLIVERLLQADPDPNDDPASAAGYRAALTDALK